MLGPTAAGKSAVAEAMADQIGARIVSVDSMQVYRGLDIGTAKPHTDAKARYGYDMVDIAEPEDDYSAAEFQRAGTTALDRLADSNTPVILAGGSGLHFRALVDPLEFPPTDGGVRADLDSTSGSRLRAELLAADPNAANSVDLANPRRVLRAVEVHRLTGATPTDRSGGARASAVRQYREVRPFTAVGVDPGEAISVRVEERFDRMLSAGLLQEVERLASRLGPVASQAVGYKELLPVVTGSRTIEEARAGALRATRSLVKRQRTFFRRDPRIRWLAWEDDAERLARAALQTIEEAGAWSS